MAINKCTITATIKDLADAIPAGINTVLEAKLYVKNERVFAHGENVITPFEISQAFDASGVASIQVIETETAGEKLEFFITYKEGRSTRTVMFYPAIVLDVGTIPLTQLTLPRASGF